MDNEEHRSLFAALSIDEVALSTIIKGDCLLTDFRKEVSDFLFQRPKRNLVKKLHN